MTSPKDSAPKTEAAPTEEEPAALPFRYEAPRARGPTTKLAPVGACIYCGKAPPEVTLTDEHIVADGFGGDLVLPASSCPECAVKTCRAEGHVMTEMMQFQRSVVGVSSRKRKGKTRTVDVKREGDPEGKATPVKIDGRTPFLFPMITTDNLPGIMRGAPASEAPLMRLTLFGPPDWNEQGQRWLDGNGEFKVGYRFHAGVFGQAIAKTAHAYACAKLGKDGFTPFLTDYILAHEPAFNGYLIASTPSGSESEALHQLDLNVASVPRMTAVGLVWERVYVVTVRLFAFKPTPTYFVVVGRTKGPVPVSIQTIQVRG